MKRDPRDMIPYELRFPDQATLDAILEGMVTGLDEAGEPIFAYSEWIVGKPVRLPATVDVEGVYDPNTGDVITPPSYLDEVIVSVMAYRSEPIPEVLAPFIVPREEAKHIWQGVD